MEEISSTNNSNSKQYNEKKEVSKSRVIGFWPGTCCFPNVGFKETVFM